MKWFYHLPMSYIHHCLYAMTEIIIILIAFSIDRAILLRVEYNTATTTFIRIDRYVLYYEMPAELVAVSI